jgi:hypothetical protein
MAKAVAPYPPDHGLALARVLRVVELITGRPDIRDDEMEAALVGEGVGPVDARSLPFAEDFLEIKALEADRGTHLNYVRVVGRRQEQAKLLDIVVSLPAQYTKKPLLRSEAE